MRNKINKVMENKEKYYTPEIEEFKIARKNYKQKKKEINTLQKQITKLYKEL